MADIIKSTNTVVLNHRDDALEELVRLNDTFLGAAEAQDFDVMLKCSRNIKLIHQYLLTDTRNRRKKVRHQVKAH